jgi:pyrroline-5-carboxylate reductase
VDDEKFVDMSTSISGSGPAYIFLLMESMIDAGVHMGFTRETATTLVHHTLLGSTLYAMKTGEHPAILRNMVTSPAGTTASAIYELENGKFRVVIKDVSICDRRSITLVIWFLTINALIVIIGNLGMLQEIVGDGWPAI